MTIDTSRPVTMEQVRKYWESGLPVLVVEYRHSLAETITWRDKTTGKTMSAPVLRHTVEAGDQSIAVNERQGDHFDPSSYAAPYKKGEKVALWLRGLESQRGLTTAQGVLQSIKAA